MTSSNKSSSPAPVWANSSTVETSGGGADGDAGAKLGAAADSVEEDVGRLSVGDDGFSGCFGCSGTGFFSAGGGDVAHLDCRREDMLAIKYVLSWHAVCSYGQSQYGEKLRERSQKHYSIYVCEILIWTRASMIDK